MSQPISSNIDLHVWPGRWNLPSIDSSCLAAILHLQIAVPGKFSIVECTNPDLSPAGQLPFLIHKLQVVSQFSSIGKYVASLKSIGAENGSNPDIDAPLNASEKSQKVAWHAHIESNLGDLVSHMFYSLEANWSELTHPTLARMLPVPQRYYVPGRLRQSHRPRLEAAGLWNLPGIEQQTKKPFKDPLKPKEDIDPTEKYLRVFEREKVQEKARSSFDIYARLLGDKRFFFHDRPTTLDIILAAHILLLINPPFPDPLIQTLLTESYPTLVAHSKLVYSHAFPPSNPQISTSSPQSYSLRSLLPWYGESNVGGKKVPEVRSEDDVRFDRMRWGWIALAVGSVAFYLYNLRIVLVMPDEGQNIGEEVLEEADDEDEDEDAGGAVVGEQES